MTTFSKFSLATLVVGGALAATSVLRAQEPQAAPHAPGMMGQGGMMNMGGDMQSMMNMMEQCTRMMQSMNSPPNSDWRRNTPPSKPDNKG